MKQHELLQQRLRRKLRTSSRVRGTAERPRLSASISNRHIVAQIINDESNTTLVYITTVGKSAKGTMTEKAALTGKEVAQAALKANIKKVVFDRGARLYHGRIKALADAARAEGLEF